MFCFWFEEWLKLTLIRRDECNALNVCETGGPRNQALQVPTTLQWFSLSLTKAMSSVRYFWCLDWCQPARHPSLNIAASEACGLPMGVLVGSSVRWSELKQLTWQKQTASATRASAALGTQDFHPDIIVDWGGSSYKVFIDGERIGTEVTLSFFFWGRKKVNKYVKVLFLVWVVCAGDGCQFISLRGWHLA